MGAQTTLEKDNTIHYKEQDKITIADVAEALGISKSTVSRSISGKGRISDETRQKVLSYIEENNYRPSAVAKGLAQSKTYNIGWIMPGDATVMDLPFFQRCMMGVSEVAASEDYDILLSMVFDHDCSQLERIIRNKKVDGIVLGRTLVNDPRTDMLVNSDIPFVVVGSSMDERVIQIDNDHVGACKELTSILLMKGIHKLALIGGDSNHVVNRTRREGFELALKEKNIEVREEFIYMDADDKTTIDRVVDDILRHDIECIVCMDDRICIHVLNKLRKEGLIVPKDMKIASFYNSAVLESNQPPITSLQYDPKILGAVACRTLFDYIEGKDINRKQLLSYEVNLKGSTQ